MSRPVRVTVWALFVLALTAGAAWAETRIYSNPPGIGDEGHQRWLREPSRLAYASGPERNYAIELRQIEWAGWGERRATATAVFKRCASAGDGTADCRVKPPKDAVVIARERAHDGVSGTRTKAYKVLVVKWGNDRRWSVGLPVPSRAFGD